MSSYIPDVITKLVSLTKEDKLEWFKGKGTYFAKVGDVASRLAGATVVVKKSELRHRGEPCYSFGVVVRSAYILRYL